MALMQPTTSYRLEHNKSKKTEKGKEKKLHGEEKKRRMFFTLNKSFSIFWLLSAA